MSRARDLSKLGNPGVFSVSADNNVGVNSTAPVEKLNVVGVVSATSFYGDGSQLEGVASAGLGTAVVSNSPYGGEQIYYTNKALNITGNLTVDVPDSAEVAYTQYQEIVVDSGADFIVGDGDDFIPDILGIGTEVQQPGLLAGGGGRVRADNFSDKSGTGAPTFSSGVVVTGVATATSFDGNLTGNADTATTATNAQGLTGTPDLNVGVITATKFVGDGSELGSTFVASGTISNGNTVIVNSNGTVSAVSGTGSPKPTVGIASVFAGGASYIDAVYDSNSNKVVVAYSAVNSYGTAVVGTITGTDIEFGTPVIFHNAVTTNISAVFDSTNNKVVIAYSDGNNINVGTAIVGTVSGDSISFPVSPQVFSGSNQVASGISAIFDPDTSKILIAYRNDDQGGGTNTGYRGKIAVGSVSTNSISFGAGSDFYANDVSNPRITYDSNTDKVVIVYQLAGLGAGNYLKAAVGTVDGVNNTVSFGSATTVSTNSSFTSGTRVVFDSTNNKVVVIYCDQDNGSYGTTRVGTVSGTDISFGDPVIFEFADTSGGISASYDSTNDKVVIAYRDNGNFGYGTVIDGTVTGTDITFGPPVVYTSAITVATLGTVYDSTNSKVVVGYVDSGGASGIVVTPTNLSTNLTTENYIGIAAEAIADGASGRVNIVGAINSSQTGLTPGQKYYANPTGGLSLEPIIDILNVPGVPVVIAGNSVSATSIIVNETSSPDVVANSSSSSSGGGSSTSTGPTHQMVASGSLSNGDLVVLNNDGTVSTVAGTRTSAGIGTTISTPFDNVYYHGVWDSSNQKLAIASYDSSSGEVVVGTVTGTGITFGTPVTFNSAGVGGFEFDMVYHEGSLVLMWSNSVRVGTISGDTITFGSIASYSPVSPNATSVSNSRLTSIPGTSNVVGIYRALTNAYDFCEMIPLSISGNTVTVGTAQTVTYHSGDSMYPDITYDSTNNKVITKYLGEYAAGGTTTNTLYATSYDFDGTNFSNKREMNVAPETTQHTYRGGLYYDSNVDRLVVIGYPKNDSTNSGAGNNVSISIGEYVSDGYYKFTDFQRIFSTSSYLLEPHVSFNSQEQTVGYIYRSYTGLNSQDPDHYQPYSYVDFKIDPDTNLIHSSEPISVDFYYSDYNVPQYVHGQINDLVYIPTENRQVAIGASRTGVSAYSGAARLITPRVTTTNLTSDNFIGISDGSYTNGETANIKVVGSISGGHTGLTAGKKYYVDSVGVLTTSKESLADYFPHKYVGVAASSDSIIVKG